MQCSSPSFEHDALYKNLIRLSAVNNRVMISLFLIISLIASVFSSGIKVRASSVTDIRVGLTSLYGNKERITIYNDSVVIGYCKNNTFFPTGSFSSKGGFTFEPDDSHYLIGRETYSSLTDATEAASKLDLRGVDAFYALTGPSSWKIYLLSASEGNEADALQKFGKDFDSVLYRSGAASVIRVTLSGYVFLIDAFSGTYPQIKAVSGGKQVPVSLGSRKYRGRIEIIREKKKLTAINIVSIEAYLLGVVTCEMGPTKPAEALKAQAVAARSFAIAKAGFISEADNNSYYKMNDTTDSQVYKGVLYETEAGYNAVKSTLGQVIKDKNGNIVQAFYFSTDGGATDSGADMWSVSSNIFEPVFDIYETDPEVAPWIEDISLKEISETLKDHGHDVGNVTSLNVTLRSEGGRAMQVKISGSSGKITLSGNEFRSVFDLSSTKFSIITPDNAQNEIFVIGQDHNPIKEKLSGKYTISESGNISLLDNSNEQYILVCDGDFVNIPDSLPAAGHIFILGMGSGHGVGMSQSGAAGMAAKGFGYKDILAYYYHNIELGTY